MGRGLACVMLTCVAITVTGCLGNQDQSVSEVQMPDREPALSDPLVTAETADAADPEQRFVEPGAAPEDQISDASASVQVADASPAGFLAFLRPAAPAAPAPAIADAAVGEGTSQPDDTNFVETDTGLGDDPILDAVSSADSIAPEPEADTVAVAAAPARRGLFGGLGLFGGGRQKAALVPQDDIDAQASGKPDATVPTSVTPAPSSEPDVALGAVMPFGQVGRVCGARKRDLGTRVDRFPTRGSTYALFDSVEGSIEPRAFYISGFGDGCVRIVTAANAVFGAPSMHERLRYGLPSNTLVSSQTDKAYKRLKSKICRVGRNKPCPADGMASLERNTVFVTLYRSFTGNQDWSNLLLHDGALVASDIKQLR